MERKLTAILSADVKGYSRLMGEDVVAALQRGEGGEKGKLKNFATVLVAKSGERIPVVMSGSVIYDEVGVEIGMIGFLKDLRDIR